MRWVFLIAMLALAVTGNFRAEQPAMPPAAVAGEIRVRVTCGFDPKSTQTRDLLSQADQLTADESTDFDVTFSLSGLGLDLSPGKLVMIVARPPLKVSRLVGRLSVYRWAEKTQKFVWIKSYNWNDKRFIREIQNGDHLIYHPVCLF